MLGGALVKVVREDRAGDGPRLRGGVGYRRLPFSDGRRLLHCLRHIQLSKDPCRTHPFALFGSATNHLAVRRPSETPSRVGTVLQFLDLAGARREQTQRACLAPFAAIEGKALAIRRPAEPRDVLKACILQSGYYSGTAAGDRET